MEVKEYHFVISYNLQHAERFARHMQWPRGGWFWINDFTKFRGIGGKNVTIHLLEGYGHAAWHRREPGQLNWELNDQQDRGTKIIQHRDEEMD